jgi:glycosyltransferase involved in cell wall biosynthesis
MTREPCLTVGLPVYNGERHLRSALNSILAQSFTDFEVVISDNASTDGTEAICRNYVSKDDRIRYYRNEANLGVSRNFNLTVERARGRYFKWAADDDVLEPDYLARCVRVLDEDPGVVLCHSQIRIIDDAGRAIADYRYRDGYAGQARPSHRLRHVLIEDRWCFEIFGVVRTVDMRKTRLLGKFVGSDRIFRAEMALRGRYAIVPEFLFLNRDHPRRGSRVLPAHHMRGELFNPALAGRRIFPHWRILLEYARCTGRAPIGRGERLACYASLSRWLTQHHNWARLVADLLIGTVPALGPFFLRTTRSAERWLTERVARSRSGREVNSPR